MKALFVYTACMEAILIHIPSTKRENFLIPRSYPGIVKSFDRASVFYNALSVACESALHAADLKSFTYKNRKRFSFYQSMSLC